MRIEFHAEENDGFYPIEIANALIRSLLSDVNDYEWAKNKKRELAEIAEHIQVFLKYDNEGGAT